MRSRQAWWRQGTKPDMVEPLAPETLHIWQVEIDALAAETPALHTLLAADEQAHAARYRFAADKAAYVTVRGLLRMLLGAYLQCAPHSLQFTYNEYGKPLLAGGPAFNVSHTRQVALLAFTAAESVGVDVERVRPEIVSDALAREVMSAWELAQFRAGGGRTELFFEIWTRKEAYIKALGTGLATPLPSVTVLAQAEIGDYSLYPLPIAVADHVGAAAVKGKGAAIHRCTADRTLLAALGA
jgi:4'-phosphopantetheinyl transferase